jgi:hypothetical protein
MAGGDGGLEGRPREDEGVARMEMLVVQAEKRIFGTRGLLPAIIGAIPGTGNRLECPWRAARLDMMRQW